MSWPLCNLYSSTWISHSYTNSTTLQTLGGQRETCTGSEGSRVCTLHQRESLLELEKITIKDWLTTFDIWGLTIQECGFKINEILYLFFSHWNSYCISVATDTWSGQRNHSFLLTIIKHEQYWNKNLQLKMLQNPKSALLLSNSRVSAYYYQPAHVIQLVRCLTFQLRSICIILNFCVKKKKEPQWNANIGQVIIRVCLLQIALLQIWLRATTSLAQPLVAY